MVENIEKNAKLILRVDDELWEKFKRTVSRTVNLDDAVVELIRRYVEKMEQGKTKLLPNFINGETK